MMGETGRRMKVHHSGVGCESLRSTAAGEWREGKFNWYV